MTRVSTALVGALVVASMSGAAGADELRMAVQTEATSIDPHFSSIQPNREVDRHIFDHLIDIDANLRLLPALAESWKPVNDKTWEFKLRPNVKFHDGTPFTADDVVFSFKRAPDVPDSPSSFRPYLRGKEIAKIDDLTVRVQTAELYPHLPYDVQTFAMISKKHGESATTADFNSGKAAIGTGAYRFVEWTKGERLVLQANPTYWRGKPKWDKVTIRAIKSDPSRVAALLAGYVDMIDKVPTADMAQLRRNPNVVISETVSVALIYLHLDSSRDLSPMVLSNDGQPLWPNPLRDGRVRKALSKAIDRRAIAERVMEGAARPAGEITPEGFFGHNPSLGPEPFDPDGAKRLLAEAGYANGFRLTIHGPNGRYVNDAKILETVAQMWTRAGIKTEVATLPPAAFFTRSSNLEFSVVLVGFFVATGEPSDGLKNLLHTFNKEAGWGTFNRGRYANARFDALLEQVLTTVDDAKREKLVQEASAVAFGDVGLIPLHHQLATWALRKGFAYKARADESNLAEDVIKAN